MSTVCPIRSISRLARSSLLMVMSSMLTPGRPSGVSLAASSRSIPASTLHPITDVAKPVNLSAAAAHPPHGLRPVMTIRATRMVNASAKVSSMRTPRIFIAAISRWQRIIGYPCTG